jgi:hypothetical protein
VLAEQVRASRIGDVDQPRPPPRPAERGSGERPLHLVGIQFEGPPGHRHRRVTLGAALHRFLAGVPAPSRGGRRGDKASASESIWSCYPHSAGAFTPLTSRRAETERYASARDRVRRGACHGVRAGGASRTTCQASFKGRPHETASLGMSLGCRAEGGTWAARSTGSRLMLVRARGGAVRTYGEVHGPNGPRQRPVGH